MLFPLIILSVIASGCHGSTATNGDHDVIVNNTTEPTPNVTEITNPPTSDHPTTSPPTPTTTVITTTTNGTTSTVSPKTTTTPVPTSSTKPSPTTNATTVQPSSTQEPTTTTTVKPANHRNFDGPSFVGGIVLASGLVAIGFVAFKFYKARYDTNYHTL